MFKYPVRLIGSIILCLAAGVLGSLFTLQSVPTWYSALNKPSFSPPNFVFAPVWTALYVLMGISLYLVWNLKKKKTRAIQLFLFQLELNVLWSIIFFGFHSPLFAFGEIIILWISIFLTVRSFAKISKPAAYLLFPYLVWVSFASVLNLAIVILNP